MEFGSLEKIDLRKAWPNEAADFTPWLAQHLNALGDVLGLDLELESREAPAGGFSVDLLARDLGRDRLVIIENQLESTNHDHLGKLLTYAAAYDAGAVIWVAKEIREEHRQAIDWLNQRTDTNTEFYGIIVELLKIDHSRPAYNFKLIAFPNQWRKSTATSSSTAEISERRKAYQAYFQDLIDQLREKHKFTGARLGQPQNWYSFASGFSGITYSISFAMGGRVSTHVYIDKGDVDLNKQLFDSLAKQRESLEAEFGKELEWERLDDRRACRIAVYRDGSIDDDTATLGEIKQWAIDRLLSFKKVFTPRLAKLLK